MRTTALTEEQRQGLLDNLRRAEHDLDVLARATSVDVDVRAGPTHGGHNCFCLTFMSGETLDAVVKAVRESREHTRDELRRRCREYGIDPTQVTNDQVDTREDPDA